VPAQVANVTTRVSIVDFGHTGDTAARQSIYTRYVTRLFVAGVAGAVATAAVVPLLPVVLGERWQPVVGLTIVFVAVAPWRLILGLAGSLAISVGRTRSLLGWETARLVATTAVMVAGAAVSIRGAALADDLTIIAAVLVLHALACRASGIRMVRGSILAAVATVLAVAPLLLLVTAPK
jgi:O-antigen/teichoic acid export membrane protein